MVPSIFRLQALDFRIQTSGFRLQILFNGGPYHVGNIIWADKTPYGVDFGNPQFFFAVHFAGIR